MKKETSSLEGGWTDWRRSVLLPANRDGDGGAADGHGLCSEEPDGRGAGRLEAEAADRLYRRAAQHLPGPPGDMVTLNPFKTVTKHFGRGATIHDLPL